MLGAVRSGCDDSVSWAPLADEAAHLPTLSNIRAELGGVLEQDMVDIGAGTVKGVWSALAHRVGELEAHFVACRSLEKPCAVLANEARLELRRDAEVVQHLEGHREQRFAQMKAGEELL